MPSSLRRVEDATVRRVVVHVLDKAHEEPILNDFAQELDDDVRDFVKSHIQRGLKGDDARAASFDEGRNLVREACESILSDPSAEVAFLEASKTLARHLFRSMSVSADIPSCDLLVALFESEDEPYLAILKLDYTRTYIHNMEFQDGKFRISIVPQLVGLPGLGQRAAFCAFASLEGELLVTGRQGRDRGTAAQDDPAAAFFSTAFLQSHPYVDATERTKRLKAATEEWTRKSLKDDATKAEGVRSAVMRSLRKGEPVDVERLAQSALRDEPALARGLVQHLEDRDVGGTITIDAQWVERKASKVKLHTDIGVDISLPTDVYEDPKVFSIQRNADGSLDLIIKGIRRYRQS